MRNQYKVLAEKYSTLTESEEDQNDLPDVLQGFPDIVVNPKHFKDWFFTTIETYPTWESDGWTLGDTYVVKMQDAQEGMGLSEWEARDEVDSYFKEAAKKYVKKYGVIGKAQRKNTHIHKVDISDF